MSCPLSNSIEAAPSEQQEQQHEVPQVGAASVAAAIAGLAACGSGWLLWRLRQRRQRRGRQRDEGLALLPLTLRHLGDSATNSISSTNEQRGSSSGPVESSSSGTNSWQQRVGALLSTRRGKIQLLPLDALGKALAHELAQQPQRGGGAPQASAAGGVGRAASTLQREWRLATESLRVTPSELEARAVGGSYGCWRVCGTVHCAWHLGATCAHFLAPTAPETIPLWTPRRP